MAKSEMLQVIAQQLKNMDDTISDLQELLLISKEAGEDVSKVEAELQTVLMKKKRWQETLEKYGYK